MLLEREDIIIWKQSSVMICLTVKKAQSTLVKNGLNTVISLMKYTSCLIMYRKVPS